MVEAVKDDSVADGCESFDMSDDRLIATGLYYVCTWEVRRT